MDTSLQHASLTADELQTSLEGQATVTEEDEHHIHLPNPSLWPVLLNMAIIVALAGMLFIPSNPWITIVAAPFVLIGILGWALEDPMASLHNEGTQAKIQPELAPQQVLEMARETVDRLVTISSTVYSTHPVTVEIDDLQGNMVVLALYGKVELEAQRDEIEDAIWQLPNILNVRNFIVAEDSILINAEKRIEGLRQKGKLEGASGISVLVENYILQLYGNVPNKEMRETLERELIGITGVRVIVNHIGLDKDIPGNLGKTRNKI